MKSFDLIERNKICEGVKTITGAEAPYEILMEPRQKKPRLKRQK